ncbi:MAG: DUF1294 domain-containing protein [Defluviitaleaceae bacterium]|nr:DUF1294 domain-containing protein [Defluviitaleaceae bacterium]
MIVFLIILSIWNIITFALFGIDKGRAKLNTWRTKEATLIFCAFVMGGFGALLGMIAFRHKTRKTAFRILIPFACLLNLVIIFIVIAHLIGEGLWVLQ